MSMDNGVYVLRTKDGMNRVIHTKAIDCLVDCFESDELGREINPIRILEFFGKTPATKSYEKAMGIAHSMLRVKTREIGYVEYGIQKIVIDMTWREIKEEAKRRIPLERAYLKGKKDDFYRLKLKELDVVERMCS